MSLVRKASIVAGFPSGTGTAPWRVTMLHSAMALLQTASCSSGGFTPDTPCSSAKPRNTCHSPANGEKKAHTDNLLEGSAADKDRLIEARTSAMTADMLSSVSEQSTHLPRAVGCPGSLGGP